MVQKLCNAKREVGCLPWCYAREKFYRIKVLQRKGEANYYPNPPASKASGEVANLTERKNPHAPVYGVKEFVCLSVTKFDPNYLRTIKKDFEHKNYPYAHHLQGGMKFATQISPLLIYNLAA